MGPFELLITVVVLAFIFDFINGFHDSANSIATVVSTRVLSPVQAVMWAAAFNFVAYWISEFKVADTVAKTVHAGGITLTVILAGLMGAIIWNLITWWRGIPSSSSHTLMGGFAGAAIAHSGWDIVNVEKVRKTFIFIFLAPLIGMAISYFLSVGLMWACRKFPPLKLTKIFKRLQLVSSALFSIGHGGNDAQKVMGIISAALIVYVAQVNQSGVEIPHWMEVIQQPDAKGKLVITHIPHWVVIGCYVAISLGTLFGGWRIVKTMGTKITKMTPFEGVTAETAGAVTLFGTEQLGIPVSTTHTITGAIVGGGLTRGISAVKWGITVRILWAWLLTIPLSGLMGGLILKLLTVFGL